MRHLSAFVLLASLATTVDATEFDHYDPIALDESATAAMHEGDLTTARILLERAALLSPYDRRLQHKLQQLKARMDGTPAPTEAEPQATATATGTGAGTGTGDSSANGVLAEPPAIWKAK